jgi:hypothetical protein
MLENGTHATIAEIAAAEKINESYVGRVLRLTLLAPDIVEAIWVDDSRQTSRWPSYCGGTQWVGTLNAMPSGSHLGSQSRKKVA